MRKIILMMPVSADGFLVIIGTSGRPVAGADITSGQEPEAPYEAQFAPPESEPARIGWSPIGWLAGTMNTSRDPLRAQARTGRSALAAPTTAKADRRTGRTRKEPPLCTIP
jgi:hypothetical protein